MRFIWPESARDELRVIERQTALRILHALTEYGDSGSGDLKSSRESCKVTSDFESAITV